MIDTYIVPIISGVVLLLTAALKHENTKIALVNLLTRKLKNTEIINLGDLKSHDIFFKIKIMLSTGKHSSDTFIEDENRQELFKLYFEVICNAYYESMNYLIIQDLSKIKEAELKIMIVEQMDWRRKNVSDNLKTILYNINSDKEKCNKITSKLESWRMEQESIINSNIINTITSGRFISVNYKLDTILYQYSLGIDILIVNGAKSFSNLNGDLKDFLK